MAEYRALLTGASSGIGLAIAQRLAERCQVLILVARNVAPLAPLVERHRGRRIIVVSGDITDAAIRHSLARLGQDEGNLNVLINNAGVSDFHDFARQPSEVSQRIMDTNLIAPIELTRCLMPQLLSAGSAQVINIGSVFGSLGFPGFAAYCASKFGLRGWSESLRREYAHTGLRVRHFAPRATRTAINPDAVSLLNQAMHTREDDPEEVAAQFMKFLSGRAAEYTIGWQESAFVFFNRLFPARVDAALAAKRRIIARFMPGGGAS